MPNEPVSKFSCRIKLLVRKIFETFVTLSLMGFMGRKFETFINFTRSAMVKIDSNIKNASTTFRNIEHVCI